MREARFYTREEEKIRCLLCPRRCLLAGGQEGACGVRLAGEGKLYTANYGLCAAAHWDPVEKKPLYHFHPGSSILSLGTYGCNLHCTFCQNWSLARGNPEEGGTVFSPEDVLAALRREGSPPEVLGAAYTYNEPTVWYEFVCDTARLIHSHGYRNVLVTNGYIEAAPLEELLPYIDAMNIDVKGFSDSFYREFCRGRREPVLAAVERSAAACHVEVTCLLIPGANDDPAEIEALSRWLASLNPNLPLHLSRYFPSHRLELPPTPLPTLETAREIALRHLHYVYLGNAGPAGAAHTRCPSCNSLLIERNGYRTRITGMAGGRCRACGEPVPIILS